MHVMKSYLSPVVPTSAQWYLVHCRHLQERLAASALADNLRLTFYLPDVLRRFRGKLRRAALFPGYLFVWANLEEVEQKDINRLPGIMRLVSFGNGP